MERVPRTLGGFAAIGAAAIAGYLFFHSSNPATDMARDPRGDEFAARPQARTSSLAAAGLAGGGPSRGPAPGAGTARRAAAGESRGSPPGSSTTEAPARNDLAAAARTGGSPSTHRRSEITGFISRLPSGEVGVEAGAVDTGAGETEPDGDIALSVPFSRGTSLLEENGTPVLVEKNLEPAADGNGMYFGRASVLAFPNAGNLRGDAGTITLEIEPDWSGPEEGDYALVSVREVNNGSNLLRLFKNGSNLRVMLGGNSSVEFGAGTNISAWQPGERHSVAVTWETAGVRLFVDGRVVDERAYVDPIEFRSTDPLYLGSDIPEAGPMGAGGVISNFRAYVRPLTPDEIVNPPAQ